MITGKSSGLTDLNRLIISLSNIFPGLNYHLTTQSSYYTTESCNKHFLLAFRRDCFTIFLKVVLTIFFHSLLVGLCTPFLSNMIPSLFSLTAVWFTKPPASASAFTAILMQPVNTFTIASFHLSTALVSWLLHWPLFFVSLVSLQCLKTTFSHYLQN